jgi:hypothetical protein
MARAYRSLARFTRERGAAEGSWIQSARDAGFNIDHGLSHERSTVEQPIMSPALVTLTIDEVSFEI